MSGGTFEGSFVERDIIFLDKIGKLKNKTVNIDLERGPENSYVISYYDNETGHGLELDRRRPVLIIKDHMRTRTTQNLVDLIDELKKGYQNLRKKSYKIALQIKDDLDFWYTLQKKW